MSFLSGQVWLQEDVFHVWIFESLYHRNLVLRILIPRRVLLRAQGLLLRHVVVEKEMRVLLRLQPVQAQD